MTDQPQVRCACGNLAKKGRTQCRRCARKEPDYKTTFPDTDPDWTRGCEVCGASPVVGDLGLCGPCTFGEAETYGGNW